MNPLRRRPSARLLVLDADDRLLLFHFVIDTGAQAAESFWATPGGALEPGESFDDAARRELREETGFEIEAVGTPLAAREFTMQLPGGERVLADERLFLVRTPAGARVPALSRAGWTPLERQVMRAHRWWTRAELLATSDTVWPADLPALLDAAGAWGPGNA